MKVPQIYMSYITVTYDNKVANPTLNKFTYILDSTMDFCSLFADFSYYDPDLTHFCDQKWLTISDPVS